MTSPRKSHPSWKIALWIVAPMLTALGALGHFIAPNREASIMNAVFVLAASSFGWAVGMFLSPDSRGEEKKFTGLWKGVSLFVSGYLVSKLDPLVEALLKPEIFLSAQDSVYTYRLLACPTATVLTAILTYVVRVYAVTVDEDA